MQRSSLLLFMEEYLWEEEWGKREVNKCSSFSFLLNKWIDKQNASPNLRPDSRQSPRRHCSISGFLSEHCDWIDPWLQCGREAQSDAALLESLGPVDGAVFNGCCCFLLVHDSVEWIRFVASAAHRSSMNKYYSIYLWRIDLSPCSDKVLIMYSGRFVSRGSVWCRAPFCFALKENSNY